jgi:erythromycin esterase-like protein
MPTCSPCQSLRAEPTDAIAIAACLVIACTERIRRGRKKKKAYGMRFASVAAMMFRAGLPWAVVLFALKSCATPPPQTTPPAAVESLRTLATPITGSERDYDELMAMIGDHQFVLLGESTHGTREFYRERARLTRRLIEEKQFTVVLLEADWPDAYDVNEFIHGRGPSSAAEALGTFTRFPQWMWGNQEIAQLLEWMRAHNKTERGAADPVGIYGMDLYSVKESMDDVIAFLRTADAAAAKRAEERYKCLARYADDLDRYAVAIAGGSRGCQPDVQAQFEEMGQRITAAGRGHRPGDDRLVAAWQNARVAANGEAYYRSMVGGGVASWNLRDRHMADTIDAISQHLNEGAPHPAKVVVWAHNSHLGDARVTERSRIGELNVGQLMRQRHDGRSVLIGFTTYSGTVRAASSWGAQGRAQPLKPSRPDSFSSIFHHLGIPAFSLPLRGSSEASAALGAPRLERFVGVIYVPHAERESHYFETDLARQYDAVVHVDQTSAIEPIDSSKGSRR